MLQWERRIQMPRWRYLLKRKLLEKQTTGVNECVRYGKMLKSLIAFMRFLSRWRPIMWQQLSNYIHIPFWKASADIVIEKLFLSFWQSRGTIHTLGTKRSRTDFCWEEIWHETFPVNQRYLYWRRNALSFIVSCSYEDIREYDLETFRAYIFIFRVDNIYVLRFKPLP